MELIRPLYDIERTLRESKAPPEEVKKKREEESSPIAEEFFKALVKCNQDTQNPPRNKLKDADRLRPHKPAASEQLAAESISAYR